MQIWSTFQCRFESFFWIGIVLNQRLVDEYLFPNRYIRVFCSHQDYLLNWIIYCRLDHTWMNKIRVLFIYFAYHDLSPYLRGYIKQIICPATDYNDIYQNSIHLCRLLIVNKIMVSSDEIWHPEWMIFTCNTSLTTRMLFIYFLISGQTFRRSLENRDYLINR